ncbi:EF-Tu/IF-2/RF-3 family GTPase [Halpernia sp. GG3]
MLSPEIKEQVIGNVEIRETFKITKVGTIAGCMVLTGKVTRNSNIRLLRDGIVKFDGKLESLKRFKDDVKEVTKGYECGLNIKGYNDIEAGDILEVYEEISVKKTLK